MLKFSVLINYSYMCIKMHKKSVHVCTENYSGAKKISSQEMLKAFFVSMSFEVSSLRCS